MPDMRLAMLTKLAAAFPRDRIEKSTVIVYANELGDCRLNLLGPIVEGLMKNARRFPSIAEIREEYTEALRREREAEADTRGLPAAHEEITFIPMPDSVKAQIAELKRKMDRRGEELEAAGNQEGGA